MNKPSDPLLRGVVKRPISGGLIKRRMAEGELSRELEKKFRLLFKQQGVAYGAWMHLAISLAVAHVPGFQLIKPAGRPRGKDSAWTQELTAKLVSDVDELLKKKKPALSESAACLHLKKTKPAQYATKTAAAMRSKYRAVKERTRADE